MVLLFAVKYYGKRGLIFLAYNGALWFTVVYLGHHWVVDILGGIAWSTVCFIIIQLAWPRIVGGVRISLPRRVGALRGRSAVGDGGQNPR